VDATRLRAKVVGEGGNLGFTQPGRVEYALAGGRIHTDFIDNSAGVDTSDHEVNIKILLGDTLSEQDRNRLLDQMTDEVAELVLRDNYDQACALGIAAVQAHSLLPVHRRMIADLEKAGRVDRGLESLPTEKELRARAERGRGLVAPELAVLLAYVKIVLEDEVLQSGIADEEWTHEVLASYFPTPLRKRYADRMAGHRLRREIVTTSLVNEAVNRGGTSFVYRAVEETGASTADVLRAYVVVCEVFDLRGLWRAVEALDGELPTGAQTAVYLQARRLLDRGVRWLMTNRRSPIDVPGEIARLKPGVSRLLGELESHVRGAELQALRAHAAELAEAGVPEQLAVRSTRILYGFGLLDVVSVAAATGRDVAEVGGVYFVLSERFRVDDLLSKISDLPREDRWQTLARMALRYDLYAALAALTADVLQATPADLPAEERAYQWEQANATSIVRVHTAIGEFAQSKADLAALSVLLRRIRTLVG
jgi:glutamate dehydrogenase